MVDDESEFRIESNVNSISEAKRNFEWSLKLRREALDKEASSECEKTLRQVGQ